MKDNLSVLRTRVRPSSQLDWGGPDVALDNLRCLVNFYDQVVEAAVAAGLIAPLPAKSILSPTVYANGQAIAAAMAGEKMETKATRRLPSPISAIGWTEEDIQCLLNQF